jgi:hypothetical protein
MGIDMNSKHRADGLAFFLKMLAEPGLNQSPENDDHLPDERLSFCANPAEYEWRYAGRQDMLVPDGGVSWGDLPPQPGAPASVVPRWQRQLVWILEGILQQGESNILARRRFYIKDGSWIILLGEGYDRADRVIKYYIADHDLSPATRWRGRWYSLSGAEA